MIKFFFIFVVIRKNKTMKKTMQLVLLLALFAVLNTSSLKSQDLVAYNNEVLYHYTLLDNQIAKFEGTIWDKDATVANLKKEYKMAKNIYKYNGPALKAIKQSSKDKYFLPTVIQFYEVVNGTLENEFKQIMDMYSKEWEDSFGTKISELDQKAVNKIVEAEQKVIDNQKKFADENDLNLN